MTYLIPSIIAITVVMAGVFAFMPVEQASTVHTTIQAAQGTPFSVTDTITFTGAAIRDSELDCTSDCIIISIIVQATSADSANNIAQIQNIELDGLELITDATAPSDSDTASYDLSNTGATSDFDLPAEELWLEGFVSRDLITSTGISPAVDALEQILHGNLGVGIVPGSASKTLAPVTAGTDDVVVEIEGVTIGSAAVITVTYGGWMVGTTEPTADDIADA